MIYWLWLQCALGAGNNRFHEIISVFTSARKVYEAGDAGRSASCIFNKKELEALNKTPLSTAKSLRDKCQRENVTVITPDDNLYPKCLLNIDNPPYALYVKGTFPDFDNIPVMCVVGTREVSEYGAKCAYSLSGRLSRGGFVIVSGGAKGSDTYAHIGAMLSGGITVAVLPNGFGARYLKGNEKLREDVVRKGGCLITEFPPDTPVTKRSFFIRNRLLSALAVGTVIIEAPVKSGALITAAYATEQNKDVFVIPGRPGIESCEGTNQLLRDGAKPVIDLNDIFSEYTYKLGDKISIEKALEKPLPSIKEYEKISENKKEKVLKPPYKLKKETAKELALNEKNKIVKKILPESLSKNAKIIYNQLDKQIFTCDDLLNPEMNANMILSALGELELFGFIRSLPGGRYTLN